MSDDSMPPGGGKTDTVEPATAETLTAQTLKATKDELSRYLGNLA